MAIDRLLVVIWIIASKLIHDMTDMVVVILVDYALLTLY